MGQGELAAALGVSQQTVSRWEHDAAVPRARRLVQLARALGLEPIELQRLAGYLSENGEPSTRRAATSFPRPGSLSDRDLILLIDRAWRELRQRLESRSA